MAVATCPAPLSFAVTHVALCSGLLEDLKGNHLAVVMSPSAIVALDLVEAYRNQRANSLLLLTGKGDLQALAASCAVVGQPVWDRDLDLVGCFGSSTSQVAVQTNRESHPEKQTVTSCSILFLFHS